MLGGLSEEDIAKKKCLTVEGEEKSPLKREMSGGDEDARARWFTLYERCLRFVSWVRLEQRRGRPRGQMRKRKYGQVISEETKENETKWTSFSVNVEVGFEVPSEVSSAC